MPSFDILSETDLQEVDNAVQNVQREISTRYDFKGSKTSIERKEKEILLIADDNYKLEQVQQMLKAHVTRRKLDARALDFKNPEAASGGTLRQTIAIKQGIDQASAKEIVKAIKDAKLKVQAAIQGDAVRISGKKKDDLQEAIALVRGMEMDLPLQFGNFRD